MRMTRVSISVPEEVVTRAKEAGLNISRLAAGALIEELDRLDKIAATDEYLSELEAAMGPITPEESERAARWADQLTEPHASRSA